MTNKNILRRDMSNNISSIRRISFDVIRIVAILSVVLVHVSAYIVIKYPDPAKTEFLIGNIFNGLSRAGVPLFVMLSGALLLNESKELYTKRFLRKSLIWMILLLIGWMLFYASFYAGILPIITGEKPSVEAFMGYLVTFKGSDYPHMWYMFMVVGMYLLIPVLRLFVKKENRVYIFCIIVGCIIVQFAAKTLDILIPTDAVITVSGFIGKFHMEPLTGYIGYLLLGWYLSTFQLKRIQRVFIYSIGYISAVLGIIVVQFYYTSIPNIRGYLYSELAFVPMVFGVAIFVMIIQLCGDRITNSKKVIALSSYSFGIYIIHVLYLELFTNVIIPYESFPYGVILYITALYVFVIMASMLTVACIGKIPYIKKVFFIK